MSFFKMSDGTAPETTGNAEMGGGSLPPIPSGTQVKAMVTEAKWDDGGEFSERHIKLRWDVIEGEFKKRVIFHKVRVGNSDANKRDKAIRMLAAIDANCGGKVMELGGEPTDKDLMSNLCNKPMTIKLEVWEMERDNGEKMSGNWICAVSSGKEQPATDKKANYANEDQAASNAIDF